jgi:cytochrome b
VLFVIWILFGGYAHYDGTALRWRPFGGHLLLGLLIFLLAWGTFGFVVTGGR